MTAVDFARLVKGAQRRSDGKWWDALCPAHDDTRPSLSFADGDEGLIVKCQRGCPLERVTAAVGCSIADLFSGNGSGPTPRDFRILATYDYQDADGTLRYQVVRLDPKDFRCRRPDGAGGWTWSMQGVRRLPYRLPTLAGQPLVYVPEGEKDADALRAAGLPATCNEGGANKWRTEHTAALVTAGVREVVVLPDHDAAGTAHGRLVARTCLSAGLTVRLLELPGLPDKGDVSDWLAAGHTPADVVSLADSAPTVTAAEVAEPVPEPRGEPDPATAAPSVWAHAKTAAELLAAGGAVVEWVDAPLVARGSLTAINAPRGTGKSAVVLARMVALARTGRRVLYLDRDNSPATLRKRLVGCGARDVPTLRVLTRDLAPAFSDTAAWRAFPLEDFDVVVIDAWDSFAEGAGEQDSRRSTLALAPLLDVVRRERAPGVILLCNVTKDGAAGRGSGTVEDRVDNVFEARDATGFAPMGHQPWWEELPPAARSEWASRATRRTGRNRPERIRLAFIASKFRDDDDPAPFVLEMDFSRDPWSVRDVTGELVAAGDASRADEEAQTTATQDSAAAELVAELARRAAPGAKPLLKKAAEELLGAQGLGRKTARELLKGGGGGRWRFQPLDGRAMAVMPTTPAESDPPGICTLERPPEPLNAATRMDIGRPHSNGANPAKNAGVPVPVEAAGRVGIDPAPDPEAAEL